MGIDPYRGAEPILSRALKPKLVRCVVRFCFCSLQLGCYCSLHAAMCVVRETELRTRAVLGARRARLLRLLLAESATVALAGGAAGVLVGWWGMRAMLLLAPGELPHSQMVRLNPGVYFFAAGVTIIVAVLTGIVPALTLTSMQATPGSTGRVASGRSWLQTSVIAAQACMSLVLMMGAALLVRSMLNQTRVYPRFRASNLLALRVALPRWAERDPASHLAIYSNVRQALEALPGASAVTCAMTIPLSGRSNVQGLSAPPEIKLGAPGSAEAERNVVATNFFEVLHIPLLAGRVFTEHDTSDAPPVAVVSEGLARRFWPAESAIGKRFSSPGGVTTVVGVVGNVKNKALTRDPEAVFYRPQAQSPDTLSFVLEASGDPSALAPVAQRAVWRTVPGATVSEVTSLDRLVERALAPARYRALLATIFAAIALLITAVGIAGLTARGVAKRMRELSIRMALGATPLRAVAIAVSSSTVPVIGGLITGIILAPSTSRFLRSICISCLRGMPKPR